MAKVRKDLDGTVLAVDEHNNFVALRANQEIPEGFFVGGHALHKGDPRDQTPPWKQKQQSGAVESIPVLSADATASAPAAAPATSSPAEKLPADGGGATTPVPIPPKSGAGSGIDAWRAYAVDAIGRAGQHIDIPDDVKRDELIAALTEAKIPTE